MEENLEVPIQMDDMEPNEEGFAYDPNVDNDVIEEVDLDTDQIGTFKIDDNMPEELKAQLANFNQKAQNLNNIVSGTDAELNSYAASIEATTSFDDDDEDSDDSSELLDDEPAGNDIIEEDDGTEVGDLF